MDIELSNVYAGCKRTHVGICVLLAAGLEVCMYVDGFLKCFCYFQAYGCMQNVSTYEVTSRYDS